MKVVVLGATGATGRLVVAQLLDAECQVTALVRHTDVLTDHPRLTQITSTALTIESDEMKSILAKSDAAICCLGHNLTLQGVYGAPQMLVRDSLKRVISLINESREQPFKLVLMSSTGVRNMALKEPAKPLEQSINLILRWLLPPHRDNENSAKLLQRFGSQKRFLEWVMVRPDTLIDKSEVSEYSWHPSPVSSPLFDAKETSRINVANALCRLVLDDKLWREWRGKTPVVYNQA
tara:strand:- start:97 stop:801 length:705 start_codon:yes stop_codon:yes gene_type:complete